MLCCVVHVEKIRAIAVFDGSCIGQGVVGDARWLIFLPVVSYTSSPDLDHDKSATCDGSHVVVLLDFSGMIDNGIRMYLYLVIGFPGRSL